MSTNKFSIGPTGPATGATAIAPSDTTNLTQPIRALTIGGSGGSIRFRSSHDGRICTTAYLPIGTYALFADRIYADGTTATGLTGWE